MCRIYNLVADLQQEAPRFLTAKFKADSDSGVTWTIKNKLFGRTRQCVLTKAEEDALKT